MENFKPTLTRQDLILITIGLIGSVLLWIEIDPSGWLLYSTFLIFGSMRVSDFFALNPYERTKTERVKFVFSSLIIITVITHVIWGGHPAFGLLAALVLVYSITNVENVVAENKPKM